MSTAVFELAGELADPLPELPIGPWTRAPSLPAFDARTGPPESRWRVSLARHDAASLRALADGERHVARALAALEDVPRRLDQSIAELRAADPRGAPPADAARTLERTLQRIADLVRGRTRIETRVGGVLVALSIMAVSGDTELWLARSLPPESARLHARSVAVAVRTRQTWTRILALVVACAGRLAAVGVPAGVAALPLVWRLVREVLREVGRGAPAAAH